MLAGGDRPGAGAGEADGAAAPRHADPVDQPAHRRRARRWRWASTPTTEDVMARPPRHPGQRVIDRHMMLWVAAIGLVMATVTLSALDLYLPGGLVEGTRSLDNARTAAFTVLVLAQLFHCFVARSDDTSAFHRLFTNRWLWLAVATSVLLQVAVVHLPVPNAAFGTEPLDAGQWLVCVTLASSILWVSEVGRARDATRVGAGSLTAPLQSVVGSGTPASAARSSSMLWVLRSGQLGDEPREDEGQRHDGHRDQEGRVDRAGERVQHGRLQAPPAAPG
ncbi:MAG: cation-translocating P-type ATPase C-terminal domain-containing protein [Desulfomicrobium escambiense]|nr:cation-translocating P-type ATPase C-terminal domain-containing protein [Desulfomicrobium escambiense]